MRVTVKNITTGAKFEAEIVKGSLAHGQVDLGNDRLFLQGSGEHTNENWLDAYSHQGFRYAITEVIPELKVEPSALMEIIGNTTVKEWGVISVMANEDIKATSHVGLQPVNRAQVIRCLYAFERYARETGLEYDPDEKGQPDPTDLPKP